MSSWLRLNELFLFGGKEKGMATALFVLPALSMVLSLLGSELWVASLNNLRCCHFFVL